MYQLPSQMEPLFPSGAPDLEDLAREIVSQSAALGGQIHPITQQSVIELLRLMNSYYSNLIEGHNTHPIDIERAMNNDYSSNPAKRHLQMESLAHINCQRALESRLLDDPNRNVAELECIAWLHRIFYDQLPDDLRRVKDEKNGTMLDVIPGEIRQREVKVGRHVGPEAKYLPQFLERFSIAYSPQKLHGIMPLIAAAASHHRLMWIHPFLDGNGRAVRLYTDAYFLRVRLGGYGLWNISRGLARHRDDYMNALSSADALRRNDFDGRGNLSNEGLAGFCRFFFMTCLDQIAYMSNLLRLDGLLERTKGYVAMRQAKIIPAPNPKYQTLKPESAYMLQEALVRGQVARGDIIRVSGLAERTGRIVLSQLLDEGLLVSKSPKGAVSLNFSTHIAGYLFPELYPKHVLSG